MIEKIKYKCQLVGIKVIEREESYTSVASFLDLDEMPTYGVVREEEKVKFSGRRIKRGLYRSGSGKLINADVNYLPHNINNKQQQQRIIFFTTNNVIIAYNIFYTTN